MLFIIVDYFLIKNPVIFMAILANRIIVLLSAIILFITIKKITDYTNFAYLVTFFEIIAVISFLVILGQYESPNFLIQAFVVMVIILGIFLIPNKWVNTLTASLIISIMFFALSAVYLKEIKFAEYSAGIVYILIIIVLSGISAFRNSYNNRKQYVYSSELLILSTADPLTGLYNRVKFDEELKKMKIH